MQRNLASPPAPAAPEPPVAHGRPGSAARRPPGRALTLALVALLCAIWGSTWLVIREGLADLPPFSSAALRFLLAGVLLSLFAGRLARIEGGARPTLGLAATLGLLNVGLSYAVIYWSETILPSGLVSLVWAIFPILLALLARAWLPEERLGSRQWLGLAASLAGLAVLFSTDVASLGPSALPAAFVLLVSPAASAVGNVAIKRHGAGTSSVLLNRAGFLIGGVALALLALLTEDVGALRLTPAALASVLYLSLAGTVLAFGLYFWLLRSAPAHQLALIAYVTPVIALALGAVAADEPVGANTVAGGALVLGGVALVLRGRRAKH